MTVTIVYADSTDGYLVSSDVSYPAARTGSGPAVFDGAPNLIYGQADTGAEYAVHEAFVRWPVVVPTGEVVTGAAFRLYHSTTNGTGVTRDTEIRQYAYATPLTAAAWRSGSTLGSLPLLATIQGTNSGNAKYALGGSTALMNLLAPGGSVTISTVVTTSRLRNGNVPTGFEQSYAVASEEPGTTNDPAVVLTSAVRSSLFGVLGAAARLSDGSWAVLESDGAATPTITLRRHTGAAATTIAALPMRSGSGTFATPIGAQGMALVADASDNLYVLGADATTPTSLTIKAYAKGSGWTWTAKTARVAPMPSYSAPINQVAAAWHATGGTGVLFAAVGHAPGTGIPGANGSGVAYASLDCDALLAGSGSAALVTGDAPGKILPQPTNAAYHATYTNETGSGLDVVPAVAAGLAGYILSPGKDGAPGDSVELGFGRYDESGTGALATTTYRSLPNNYGRKDGSAKVRLVSTGTSTLAVVSADQDAGWGLTVVPLQSTSSGTSGLSGAIKLSGQGIASMPAESVLAGSLAWDVVYVPRDNKLWVYYPDATDGRIIRRTGVDLSTYQATGEVVTVSTVGAAGGTNLAVRVARQADVSTGALVTVAHKASGGALSTVYVLDSYNTAPAEPTLSARGSFDATGSAEFSWTFNDPNLPSDGQTAYQLEIINAATSAIAYDSGKVVSSVQSHTLTAGTLSNGNTYQWRVRTYDVGDLVSPYSPYAIFGTGTGGTVTITSPAADYPPGIETDDYLVTWTVAGTTQDAYKVVLKRIDTGATVSDTGWIASTATSHLVSGMATDVEHEIRVTVRNIILVESSTAVRRIIPSYGTPEVPTIELLAVPAGGYVLVSVDNPTPDGDRPVPTVNRVWRRQAGAGEDYVMIGEVPPGEPFRDYTAASGTAYEYRAEAVAA